MPPVIYGGLLTIGMVRSKLDEHKLRDVPAGGAAGRASGSRLGPFEIELVHMAHSIPDARAVALRTERGDGPDHRRLQVRPDPGRRRSPPTSRGSPSWAARACSASAATRPTPTAPASRPRSRASARRCSTSSRAARGGSSSPRSPRTSTASSRRSTRPPRSTAGSRWSAARCARTSTSPPTWGSPRRPDGLFIQPKEIEDFPDEKVVVISTGSQGEPLSALRRMAHNDHRDVELHSGDTVIFSATPIPGNERSVNETIDRIFQIGAQVVTAARRADPRLRPRLAGGAEADAQPDQAALRVPVPRRPQAAAPARRPRRVRRASTPSDIFIGQERPRARDRRARRPLRRGRPREHDLRRRRLGRRARRRSRCATAASSPTTASSSSSRRSPPTTAPRSPSPR